MQSSRDIAGCHGRSDSVADEIGGPAKTDGPRQDRWDRHVRTLYTVLYVGRNPLLLRPDQRESAELSASWNVAPTQQVGVVVAGERGAVYGEMRWGLIPSWAADVSIGARLINARAETVAEKPSFRAAYRSRRCVIPVSGFYEWRQTAPELGKKAGKTAGAKQPYYVTMASGEPMSFAGLWEKWRKGDGAEVLSCTIITTAANALIAPIHDRMPVILSRDDCEAWMRPAGGAAPEPSLLQPCPAEWLRSYRVSTRVNSPRNNDPSLIEPEADGDD